MKKTYVFQAILALCIGSAHAALDLEPEEFESIQEIGFELEEQIEELEFEKDDLSVEIKVLREEGELEVIGFIEANIEQIDKDMALIENLLKTHRAWKESADGNDEELFELKSRAFEHAHVNLDLMRELNELEKDARQIRHEIRIHNEEGLENEVRRNERILKRVELNIVAQKDLVSDWTKIKPVLDAGNHEDAEQMQTAFDQKRHEMGFKRELMQIQRHIEEIEEREVELGREKEKLMVEKYMLRMTMASREKIHNLWKQMIKAQQDGDDFRAEELEEKIDGLNEKIELQHELKDLQVELREVMEGGNSTEVGELKAAIQELQQELKQF